MYKPHNITLGIVLLAAVVFCGTYFYRARRLVHKEAVVAVQDPRTLVDSDTLAVLDACAEKNVSFLKGKITQESIQRFKDYCLETFRTNSSFVCALYSFTASKEAGKGGVWSAERITSNSCESGLKALLEWLQKNYIPKADFKFFHVTREPYRNSWTMEQKIQDELNGLLDLCPLLISCTHPDLPWTKKGILIPDQYIIGDEFSRSMKVLLESKIYDSMQDLMASNKKGLAPFAERKSSVFFRGGLAGPKLPFSRGVMHENPRHYLLTLVKDFPYLDVKITCWQETLTCWQESGYQDDSSYTLYMFENFFHLKGSAVDFFEHAKNKYLLSCDGFGSAWSRVELIMATGSVLFLNAECEQYFYSLIENNKTHVVINKDFSNLDAEFNRLKNDPEGAQKIGEQAREFAKKFFTKGAIDTYLWLVLEKLERYGAAN